MRQIVILITVGIALTAATAWSQCCSQPRTRCGPLPGPELSGNYAIPYMYSCETGRWYADPMYYHAYGALDRWHKIRRNWRTPASTPKVYEQVEE
jgi:hypothetical protein